MSLVIDPDRIEAVLLGDGTWYRAVPDTVLVDAYEFVIPRGPAKEDLILHSGPSGAVSSAGIGFRDLDTGRRVFAPLSAVQAVRYWPEADG